MNRSRLVYKRVNRGFIIVFLVIFSFCLFEDLDIRDPGVMRNPGVMHIHNISAESQQYNYLVLTTDLVNNSGILNDFISFKKACGYNTQIITVESIVKDYTGADNADKIRNFLVNNYVQFGLKYLLIIGDPYNSSLKSSLNTGGTIPMRYCYPDPSKHSQDGAVATDYYFADLTGNWDSDKDGYFGEYNEDKVNFENEIVVGRIPFDDPNTVRDILKKSILFETRNEETKKKILMAASITHASSGCGKTDHAALMETIWNDFLKDKGFSRVTMYEKDGIDKSFYSCDFPLNRDNLTNGLSRNTFGLAMLFTSWGSYSKISRAIWKNDSNNNGFCDTDEKEWQTLLEKEDLFSLPASSESAIYYVLAYSSSKPDIKNDQCLAKILLTTKGVAVIGDSSNYWFSCGWDNKEDGGALSIAYYLVKGLSDKKSVGESLYNSLVYYFDNYMFSNWQWKTWHNLYTYGCLYGDPSLGVPSSISVMPPSAPLDLSAAISGASIKLEWKPSVPGSYPISGYSIFRGTVQGGEENIAIGTVDSSTKTFIDSSVSFGVTYYYFVKAFDSMGNYSVQSNEIFVSLVDNKPPIINISSPLETDVHSPNINIIGTVSDDISGVEFLYINGQRVAFDNSGGFYFQYTLSLGDNLIKITAIDRAGNEALRSFLINYSTSFVLVLQIDNRLMLINQQEFIMDVAPIIKEGRTILPIKYVVEPLGGYVEWDSYEKKVTVKLQENLIYLWVGKNKAMVNGVSKAIDPQNNKVVPVIVNSRTMVPLRFVAENLGCDVQWDAATVTITIRYPKQ